MTGAHSGAGAAAFRALIALVTAAAPAAQNEGLAGSESYVSFGTAARLSGGGGTSENYVARLGVGGGASQTAATSETYQVVGGGAVVAGPLPAGAPLVFGTLPAVGDKSGGDVVTLVGYGFNEPGAGMTGVAFGGTQAQSVVFGSNTTLSVTTPPGVDLLGNPLGAVDVVATNLLGTGRREDGYAYLPAMVEGAPAVVGGQVELALFAESGSLNLTFVGTLLPAFVVPFPGFDGALAELSPLLALPLEVAGPDGAIAIVAPVPDKPAFAGLTLLFQTISATELSPPGGSWSNRVDVHIHP